MTVYIQLLEEGTIVYRPVPALRIEDNIYKLDGWDICDQEDEIWEFAPGTYVLVEEREFDGKTALVAIKEQGLKE